MAEWIRMPFGMVSGVGWGLGVLDGGGDLSKGKGSFGAESGVTHGNLLHSCAEVHEPIELSFGLVSGMG